MIKAERLTSKATLLKSEVPWGNSLRIIPTEFLKSVLTSLRKKDANGWNCLDGVPNLIPIHKGNRLELAFIGVPSAIRKTGYAKILLEGFAAYMKKHHIEEAEGMSANHAFWDAVSRKYKNILKVEISDPYDAFNDDSDLRFSLP